MVSATERVCRFYPMSAPRLWFLTLAEGSGHFSSPPRDQKLQRPVCGTELLQCFRAEKIEVACIAFVCRRAHWEISGDYSVHRPLDIRDGGGNGLVGNRDLDALVVTQQVNSSS